MNHHTTSRNILSIVQAAMIAALYIVLTALGALGTYALRKHRFLCTLCPVISNGIIIPLVLRYAYAVPGALWFLALTVGAGELICCVLFGSILIAALLPHRDRLFK